MTQPKESISDLKYRCIIAAGVIGTVVLAAFILYAGYLAVTFMFDTNMAYQSDVLIYENTSIASLSDTSFTSGSFFLGIGGFDDDMYFTYYEGTTSFKLKRVRADESEIFTDEDDHPYISKVTTREKYGNARGDTRITNYRFNQERYEFHVPKNTIVKSYTLDGVQ